MSELTQEYLKSIIHYDPTSGTFTYISNKGKRAKIGDIAGGIREGYRILKFDANYLDLLLNFSIIIE